MTEPSRDLLACAAALLEQGRGVDRVSRPLTVAALIGIVIAAFGPLPGLLLAATVTIALAGLAEAYFAMRVSFDAAVFRAMASAPEAPSFAGIDQALAELGLLPAAKRGRPADARIAGCRRLLRFQIVAFMVQLLGIAVAASMAVVL